MFYLTENTNRDPSWFANFAALFSCMFGLASGILMFVQEREQGTDQLLANLPITSCWTIYVKFSIGLIAVGLFVSVSLTLAYVIATLAHRTTLTRWNPRVIRWCTRSQGIDESRAPILERTAA